MEYFPDQGPREWTPRIRKAFKEIEWLRALIPPDLIVEIDKRQYLYDSLTGNYAVEALRIDWRKNNKQWYDHAWVTINGEVIVERTICDLLAGKLMGYKHLAGRWDGSWPPPKSKNNISGKRIKGQPRKPLASNL